MFNLLFNTKYIAQRIHLILNELSTVLFHDFYIILINEQLYHIKPYGLVIYDVYVCRHCLQNWYECHIKYPV